MFPKSHSRLAFVFVVCGGIANSALGDEPKTLVPTAIELKATPCGNGWQRWESIGNIEGVVAHRERITALVASGSDVWVGTCDGRLLTQHENRWILQSQLDGIQITGLAIEGADRVWLSTSDGIRRLDTCLVVMAGRFLHPPQGRCSMAFAKAAGHRPPGRR